MALLASCASYFNCGTVISRVVNTTAVVVMCALHIHQGMGREELHFGIFVSLAFLLCYRNWRVVVFAASLVAVHHLTFNWLQELGYGVICLTKPGLRMVLVHAGYVVAETAVLCYLAVLLERDALQSAELKSAIAAIRQDDKTINLSPRSEAVSSSGKALEDVLQLISEAVGQVQATAFTTTDAANQIATNSAELENRTRQQSSSISTVVNEMNSLRETIQVNVEHAGKADHLATDASSVARRGGTQVTKLVERMGSIDSSSRRIAEIITVIDGIAFQTNILALNAAVEAARAGEQGRGFAVVASEVRSLAQRSAVAAKEIKALIEGSVSEVKLGTELANETGETMAEIVHSVNAVTHIINEIATGSAEQEKRANRVGVAAQALEENTAQNASMVEAAAQAADLLREQATTLKQVVGVFTLQPSSKTKAVHRTALLR